MLSQIVRRMSLPRLAVAILALAAAVTLSLLPTWRAQAAVPTPVPASSGTDAAALAKSGKIPTGKVLLLGRIAHPVLLDVRALATRYPQHTQTVTFQSGAGKQTHTYTGPLLYDVLQAAKPSFRADVKNDSLRYAVVVHASDNYESVVSWPEIDPGYANTESLLAVTEDGKSLAADGPRLTAPKDTKGGRYVSNVISVALVRAGL
ncbi:putative molybdopterin-dependent oxidoreductase [Frankia sp. AiPs1]|uniref:hypothetical protein n=1 Tax=Frankia sp. AiPa1 TaxID=573492 RepID=UPI00202B3234|nr:hypothetical protein [Frankia sp. AiPa1]MCL9757983.1 hypothetical protein [Frankia sp. AiPa1]